MPFGPDRFLQRFDPLRRARQHPAIGYVATFATVASAAGLRWAAGGMLSAVPFITFFPAIVLATFVGGVWCGVLALLLSVLVANYLFLAPAFAFSTSASDLTACAMFVAVSAIMVVLVGLLNRAVDHLWRRADSARFLLETEAAGVVAVDDQGIIRAVNATIERQLGYARRELLGQPVDMLVPTERRASHGALRASFAAAPGARSMGAGRDLHAVRKDGSLVPVEVALSPFQHNSLTGTLATVVDISERKALERRAEVLSNEVRHRAGNLLTVVHAVARRTIPREHRSAFISALDAIARTQNLAGANAPAPLRGILDGELVSFRDQVTIVGCDVLLRARIAEDFTLIVHELTTNALKYGALSIDEGRVVIEGAEEGRMFAFTWEEQAGPQVTPPAKHGFGQTILQKVAGGFSREVEMDYPPGGFRYALRADLDRIGASDAAAALS